MKSSQPAVRAADDFDIVAAVPVGLTDDAEAARATFRQDLIPYASLPFYRAMLESSGFGDELAAFDAGMAEGDVEKAKAGLSDEMLDALSGHRRRRRRPRRGRAATRRRASPRPCIGGDPGHRLRRRARGRRRADRPPAQRSPPPCARSMRHRDARQRRPESQLAEQLSQMPGRCGTGLGFVSRGRRDRAGGEFECTLTAPNGDEVESM